MKKVFLFVLVLMIAAGMIPGAMAGMAIPAQLEGVILEVGEDGSFLMGSISQGQILVQINEETLLEGVSFLTAGQYVFVDYDGAMAESLPPQVTAQKISCFVIEGTVLSLDEAARTALVESEKYSLVTVHLPEMEAALHEGDFVAVYFSGIMALSYPAQAGGLKVDVYAKASGTVAEIGEGYFMLDTETGAILVNLGEETALPEALEAGDEVTVLYNGMMAFSAPPQIFGLIVK